MGEHIVGHQQIHGSTLLTKFTRKFYIQKVLNDLDAFLARGVGRAGSRLDAITADALIFDKLQKIAVVGSDLANRARLG